MTDSLTQDVMYLFTLADVYSFVVNRAFLVDSLEKALANLAAVVSYFQAIAESYFQAIVVIELIPQMAAQSYCLV